MTLLVRLKPFDPRRGYVLRRFTYRGIKLHGERGWYRVDKAVAEYLRSVRAVPGDELAPLAFDVCTDEEAKALEMEQEAAANTRKKASDPVEATTTSAAREDKKRPSSSQRRGSSSK